jgi:hypothetical protein
MQRRFKPMRTQGKLGRKGIGDVTARVVSYEAFVDGKFGTRRQIARTVNELPFEPKYEKKTPPLSGLGQKACQLPTSPFLDSFRIADHPLLIAV